MAEWIDITRPLHDGMVGWPGDPPLRMSSVADLEADGVQVTEIRMSVHVGTHVDAPLHCFADGADVVALPLQRLCGPAVVVDLRPARAVTIDHLHSTSIAPADRVLLRLAMPAAADSAGPGQPHVLAEAAQWLVDRGVSLLGLDVSSPDPADARDLPAHHILLGAGIPIVENLDLAAVPPGRYELVVLPLPIRGCEAAPARAILRACEA